MSDPLRDPAVLRSLRELSDAMSPHHVVVVGAAALLHHRPGRLRITHDVDLAVAVDPRAARFPDGWTREQPPSRPSIGPQPRARAARGPTSRAAMGSIVGASRPARRRTVQRNRESSRDATFRGPCGPRQRWRDRDGHPIDIVPATEEDLRRGFVDWPDATRMSLVGFDLVMRDAVRLSADGPANLLVADLLALSVCKVVAWTERPGDRRKDLRDLATILETYVEIEQDRFHDEPDPSIEFEARAPFLLGVDLARRGSPRHLRAVRDFLAQMSERDGRAAAIFLNEARAVGNWDEDLVSLRLVALRRGLDQPA